MSTATARFARHPHAPRSRSRCHSERKSLVHSVKSSFRHDDRYRSDIERTERKESIAATASAALLWQKQKQQQQQQEQWHQFQLQQQLHNWQHLQWQAQMQAQAQAQAQAHVQAQALVSAQVRAQAQAQAQSQIKVKEAVVNLSSLLDCVNAFLKKPVMSSQAPQAPQPAKALEEYDPEHPAMRLSLPDALPTQRASLVAAQMV